MTYLKRLAFSEFWWTRSALTLEAGPVGGGPVSLGLPRIRSGLLLDYLPPVTERSWRPQRLEYKYQSDFWNCQHKCALIPCLCVPRVLPGKCEKLPHLRRRFIASGPRFNERQLFFVDGEAWSFDLLKTGIFNLPQCDLVRQKSNINRPGVHVLIQTPIN